MLSEMQHLESKTQNAAHRIGVFGGVYSNYLALNALLKDSRAPEIQHLYCLGDLGAFGPLPDQVCELLRETGIPVIQGNYDNSVGNGLADCQCGYTDPRAYRALLCHGSPRKTNEFLWETTTSDAFLDWLFERYDTDIIVATHTGLHLVSRTVTW